MLHKRIASVLLLAGSIVGPRYLAVNGGVNDSGPALQEWADGSPMPIPKPTGRGLIADGSPMPVPKPTAIGALTNGSPIPIPKLTSAITPAA